MIFCQKCIEPLDITLTPIKTSSHQIGLKLLLLKKLISSTALNNVLGGFVVAWLMANDIDETHVK